jgi:hypothetical protein
MALAMFDEVAAGYEFECQKRRARLGEPRIEQLGDVRVLQLREDSLLAQEADALVSVVNINA